MTIQYEDTRLCMEKYLSISNNDSGLKKIAHLYEGVEDQVIDFGGKALMYDEPVVPFVLQKCKNLTLKNFSINFKAPFYLQAQVVALDTNKRTIDLQIMEECTYDIRGEKLYFRGKAPGKPWHGRGSQPAPCTKDMTWEQNFEWNMWFREDGTTPKEEPKYYLLQEYTCEEIAPQIVRLHNAMDNLPEVGWHIVIKGKKEQNRRYPAIFIEDCENITLENVTVYNSSGMALISQRSDTITLNQYNVKLPEDSPRICSSTADGTHFCGCKGKITLQECYFENMLDDASNVHGIFVIVEKLLDDHTVLCRYGHSQQMGVTFAGKGDEVRAYVPESLALKGEGVVKEVKQHNNLYFELAFEEKIVGTMKAGMVLDNKTWQPDILIKDCVVKNNRARSLLLQSEKQILLEGNVFEGSSMNCIQFSGDADFWYESGYVNDVVIRKNVFRDVRDYIITAYVESESDVLYHHNIDIYDNDIYSFHSRIMKINAVENLKFRDNRLHLGDAEVDEFSYVQVECEKITIENNVLK